MKKASELVNTPDEVEFEVEGDSYAEKLLRSIIQGYAEAATKYHDKNEITFRMTLTQHKVLDTDGYKHVAYLRLEKVERPKGSTEDGIPSLVHQEVYVFSDLKERLNPNSPYKEQLMLNMIARLIAAGLEYSDFLRKAKQMQVKQQKTEEERLADIGLVKAETPPAPLTPEDEEYKKWLMNERAKDKA